MPESNYLLTITWDSVDDRLHRVETFIKANQPYLQERIDTDLKFKMDMGTSVILGGLAANILATERMGGHSRYQLLNQCIDILAGYLEHEGDVFATNQNLFG